jgi:hypothetical protein
MIYYLYGKKKLQWNLMGLFKKNPRYPRTFLGKFTVV